MKHIKLPVIFFHLLFWSQNIARNLAFPGNFSALEVCCDQLFIACLCYINYFLVAPYILRKNRPFYYLIWLFTFIPGFTVLYFCWVLLQPSLFGIPEIIELKTLWLLSFNISFLYGAMSAGSRLAYSWHSNNEKNKELLLQKTNAQIQHIKSNVSIPFLLDTLTSMAVQSLDDPVNAERPIVLLSDILRYSLYDSQASSTDLKKEIEMLETFMALQKLVHPELQLTLHLQEYKPSRAIVPHLFVRMLSEWTRKISLMKTYRIMIHCSSHETVLQLPIENLEEGALNEIKQQFPDFKNDQFRVCCSTDQNYLYLSLHEHNL